MDNDTIQIKNEANVDIDDSIDSSSSSDPIAICRGCLQKGFQMQNIFDAGLCILQMLQELTSILHVQLDDDLPQQMCRDCVQRLEQAVAFKKQIESVDALLHINQNTKDPIPNHVGAVSTDKSHIGTRGQIENGPHLSSEDTNGEVEKSSDKLKSKGSNPLQSARMEKERLKSSIEFVRHKYGQRLTSDEKLAKQKEEEKGHTCPECRKIFTFKEDLEVHASVHPENDIWRCSNCQKEFKNRNELKQHIVFHFKEKPFECDLCRKRFAKKESLRHHLERHMGKSPAKKFKCIKCPKTYVSSFKLEIHSRLHSGMRPFQCPECKKSFHSAPNLRSHQLTHDDEKRFMCDICKKGFKHASTLTTHTRAIHTGERPYQCQLCTMSFYNSSKLSRHQSVHDKPTTSAGKYGTGQRRISSKNRVTA